VARANVRINRVAARVRVVDAAGFGHAELRAARFDLVLANLLPGALVGLAPEMRRRLRPGGIAVLSGLLQPQAREVSAIYAAMGFQLVCHRSRDGWTALTLVRR
jgi:ribosomal protein L11 methyltransferase